MLELDAVEIRHGAVPAVRGLTLSVAEREIVGLIGPNGAGKSTTLHGVVGLLPLHGGDVRLGGRSIRGDAPEAIARAGVALVPEGRLVEQQNVGARDERAGDRELLLLPARERARRTAAELAQHREQLVHLAQSTGRAPVPARSQPEPQVLLDGEVAEDAPSLGHECHAGPGDRLGRVAADRAPAQPDVAAVERQETDDAVQGR